MNKQELIKEFREVGIYSLNIFGTEIKAIPTEIAITSIEQLDEQKPVKVPPFVADVIEGAREESPELEDAFKYAWEVATIEFREWFRKLENRNNFARAWLDGYEVEKEKRYLVRMKGIEKEKCYLNYNFGGVWLFYNQENFYGYRAHHTRKELEEANFGWVFDCEGVEVEEVE
nr:MAG TPA: Protein of unknown function (DUF1642) [Caudoviricetes sp.]